MKHLKEQTKRRQAKAIGIKKQYPQVLKHPNLQDRNNIKKKPKT